MNERHAIVLAGGASRRMGRDKASLPFGPETLIGRVLRTIRPEVSDIVIAAPAGSAIEEGARVVPDEVAGEGPLAALANVLETVSSDWARATVLVVAVDLPLLDQRLIRGLFELLGPAEACVPVVDGRRVPTCAVYRVEAAARAAATLVERGERRLGALPDELDTFFVGAERLRAFDADLRSFAPCNTPDQYRRALALAGLPPPPADGERP